MSKLRHGFTRRGCNRHPLYVLWEKIKQRCYGAYDVNFKRYGGRGIFMCREWLDDCREFVTWALSNGYKKGLQIDRIDNDGPYAPWNCRFVSPRENANNRCTTKRVVFQGVDMPFQYAVEKSGTTIDPGTIWARMKKGMSFADAIRETNYRARAVVYNGETMTFRQAWIASGSKVKYATASYRYRRGKTFAESVS